MPEPTPILTPLAGSRFGRESNAAVLACNDFLTMPQRSVRGLARLYQNTPQKGTKPRSYHTLRQWSEDFEWQERAAAFDYARENERNAIHEAEVQTGLALKYQRVRMLKEVAATLFEQLWGESQPASEVDEHANWKDGKRIRPNLWLYDVKQIGSGESAERVWVKRFNGALIKNISDVLAALAKETGGRQPPAAAPKVTPDSVVPADAGRPLDLSHLSTEELETVHRLMKKGMIDDSTSQANGN